jgi:hypothetical protein
MRKLVVFLILLAVVLGILDRVVVSGVEREIARQVEARYDLDSTPQVEVHGIPFLTQAISGKYQEITIKIGALRYDSVRVAGIDARLLGVNAQLNDLLASNAKITVDEVIGTVVISKETIDARAPDGVKIEGTGEDTLRVTGEIPVRNVRVPVTATMEFEVVRNGIRIRPREVKVGGNLAVPNARQLISWTVPLRNLPLDLKVTKVRSTPEGLAVEARAKDVPLKG